MQIPRPKSIFRTPADILIKTVALLAFVSIFQASYAQINTAPYQLMSDTAGSLLLDRNGNTIDLSAEPYLIGVNQQNVNAPVTALPFAVLFMGNNLTHFMVNSNGCVVMAPSASISFTAAQANNFQLVNSSYAVFAPFWSSLATAANAGIKYKTIGTAPYRCLVVEWHALAPATSATNTYDMRFQMRFYETSNIIEYVYGKMKTGGSGVKATIGFSTASAATDSLFIAVKKLDTLAVTSLSNELPAAQSLVNSADTGIIKGLHSATEGRRRRIAFVPDALTVPSNLSAFNISYNDALLYWDDNSDNESGFTVYKVENGILIADTTVAPNITFRQLSGLLAGTTYQYRVKAYNNYTASYSNLVMFKTTEANLLVARYTGNWTDTSTWGGITPTINDSVVIPSGITVTMDAADGYCHQLRVNGTLQFADNSAAKKLTVNYNLVNTGRVTAQSNPSFNGLLHELKVGRHLTNNQVLNLYNVKGAYTSAVSLTFNGTQHAVFSGTGDTTNLYNLALFKNDPTDSLTIRPANLWIRNAATDALSGVSMFTNTTHKGTLRISGTFTGENRLFATGTIGTANNLSVCIDNPNYTVSCVAGDVTVASGCSLKLMRGNINVSGSLVLGSSNLYVEGGTLNIAAQLKNASTLQPALFSQTSGRIITNGVTLNAPTNIISLTGGDLVINGNSTILADINRSLFSAATVQFGTSASQIRQFNANGYYPHMVIDTTISNNSLVKLTLNGSTAVYGNIRVTTGDTIDIAGNTLTVYGDSLNINGTLKGSSTGSKLSFLANARQYVTGTGAVTTDIFETDKPDTTCRLTIQLSAPLLANTVLMSGGKIIHASALTIGNGTANSLLKYGKSSSRQQGAYFDEAPSFNIGTGKYSVYYLHESQPRVTAFEIPAGRKIAGLFMSNKQGVTVTGGTIEVFDTLRLDSGIITTSAGNEIIVTDTLNHLAVTGGGNNAYIRGPFTRRVPANTVTGKSYVFPVGDITYKPFVIINPVTTATVDLRIAASSLMPGGTLGNTLQDLDSTGCWYVQLANGTAGLSSYKTRIYNSGQNAFSRIALVAARTTTLTAADIFVSAGKRIAYNIDTLESVPLTSLNATTPVHVFAQGHSIPDTLFAGKYTIGTGGNYLNLSTAAEALNSSYIDGPLVFELLQSYDLQNEKFPVGFEQSLYTKRSSSKKVVIRLAKNVTAITTANDYSSLTPANALIDLSGADSITFDGMGYDALGLPTGTMEWNIRTAAATIGVPVFRFVNGAQGNRLQSLKITGNNISTASATILFAGAPKGNTGNSGNRINGCVISSASSANPSYNHIYAKGESALILNTRNEISNNTISDASGRGIEISSTGNGPYWKINNNNFFQAAASANAVIPVSFIAGAGSYGNEISWNTIGGTATGASGAAWNYSGAATFTAIQISADATAQSSVSNNTVKNLTVSNSLTTAAFRGIYAAGGKINVLNNKIDSITLVGRGASNAIQMSVNDAASQASDNQLSNIIQNTGAASTIRLRGILCDGNGPVTISNNNIFNLSAMGTNTDYRDASTAGIYIASSGQQVKLSNNRIWNLSSASTGCVTGISVNSNASGTINANNIYNLTNASTLTTRYIMAINVENGIWKVYNNKISLSNTGNEARGIVISGIRMVSPLSQPSEIYYNTVHIGGTTSNITTSAVSYCYSQLNSTYAVLKNNIFTNTRTTAAIHWALYVSGGNWMNTTSDFNVYYAANTAAAVSTNGSTAGTLQSFLGITPGDKNSILNSLPVLKNIPDNISLADTVANCVLNGIATPVAQITEDYNGATRQPLQPDPGAEEFVYTQSAPPLPVFLSGNDTLCAGASRLLLMSNPPATMDIEWFAQPSGGAVLFTGRDFATGPVTTDTVFYAHIRSGSCKSLRIAVPVKTKPVAAIEVIRAPSGKVCAGSSHQLLVATAPGVAVNWFADSTTTILLHTGNTFTTGILNNDTSFYVEASNGICGAVKKQISIYVDSATTLSPPVTDTLVSICANGTITLTAQSPDDISWYALPVTNNPVSSGNEITFTNLQSDTVVYVSVKRYSCESERIKVQVKVYAAPVLPQLDSVLTVCYKQPLTIAAEPAAGELVWYADSVSSNPVFNGNTFISAPLENDTVFYYSITNGPCASNNRRAVSVRVHTTDIPEVDDAGSVCLGTPVTLSVNNAGNYTAKWYASPVSTAAVFTGTSLVTDPLMRDTVFYVTFSDATCSSERVAVPVDIIESSAAPQVVSVDTVCKGSVAAITVSSAADVKWYASLSSTDILATGTTFTTTPLNNDTLFYAVAVYGNCISARVPAIVKLKAAPQPPIVDPLDISCAGQSVLLTATASDSVKWYTNATSTNPLARGNTFRTPVLNASATYYIVNDNGSCTSNRIPVPVTITPAPQAPVVSDPNFRTCYNQPVMLKATGNGMINWYASATGTVALQRDSVFMAPGLTRDTVFYAETVSGSCTSARTAVPVSVLNYMGNVQIMLPDSAIIGTDISILSQGPQSSIYSWSFGPGASLSGASGQGPFTLHYNTPGQKTISLSISRRSGNLNCDTTISVRLNVVDTMRVGLNELNPYLSFSLYPNPAHDVLHLSFDLKKAEPVVLELLDMTGRVVWTDQAPKTTRYEQQINVSGFGKGMFILRTRSEGFVQNTKLIIE